MSSSDNPQLDPQPPKEEPAPVPTFSVLDSGYQPPSLETPPPRLPPPAENPVWNGWEVLFIIGLALVSIVVSQFTVLLVAQRFYYPRLTLQDVMLKPIVLLVSEALGYVPIAAFMFLLVEGKYHVPFWRAVQWNWPRSAWKMLGLGAVLLVALTGLQSLLPMPKDTPFEHLFDRPRDAYLLSLLAVTLGPLMEELLFRGFMYPVLARRLGPFWGVILTALPFGLIHGPQYGWAWAAVLVIFLVGVTCGVVRAVTKSVGASFLVHVGYNGAQMLIAIVATHGFRNM